MEAQYPGPWYEVTVRFTGLTEAEVRAKRQHIEDVLNVGQEGPDRPYLITRVSRAPAWLARVLDRQLGEEVEDEDHPQGA